MPFLSRRRWTIVIGLLCALAAVRIFLFAAIFPMVNNVDESAHVDLVFKYSHGYLPRVGVDQVSPDATTLINLYRSPEYMMKPAPGIDGGYPPALWRRPDLLQKPGFRERLASSDHPNKESASLPLYYALAGGWLAAGRAAGISGGNLLYWVRFLDVIFGAALVWVAYLIVARVFPGDPAQRLGVPLMVAVFPQDALYSVAADALVPLVFSFALYAMIRTRGDDAGLGWNVLAGLGTAAAVLTKISDLYVVVPLGIVVTLTARSALGSSDRNARLLRVGALLACAVVPVAAWMARNEAVLGSWMGTAQKIAVLDWTVKPVGEWLSHPIFTPAGAWYFLHEVIVTFWRGEIFWHAERLRQPLADGFYVVSSIVFLAACLVGLVWNRRGDAPRRRLAIGAGLATVVASMLFLVLVSVPYDYGHCAYPSRALPYVTSGRLIAGALVPFLVAYVDGLQRLLGWTQLRVSPLAVVGTIAAWATLSEIVLSVPVASSRFNWFHL